MTFPVQTHAGKTEYRKWIEYDVLHMNLAVYKQTGLALLLI